MLKTEKAHRYNLINQIWKHQIKLWKVYRQHFTHPDKIQIHPIRTKSPKAMKNMKIINRKRIMEGVSIERLTGRSTLLEAAFIGSDPIYVIVFKNKWFGLLGRRRRRIRGRSCSSFSGHSLSISLCVWMLHSFWALSRSFLALHQTVRFTSRRVFVDFPKNYKKNVALNYKQI